MNKQWHDYMYETYNCQYCLPFSEITSW